MFKIYFQAAYTEKGGKDRQVAVARYGEDVFTMGFTEV